MVLIGLLLMAAAVGLSIDVFVQNTADIDVQAFGHTYAVAPGWLVVTGIAAVVVFLVGVRLVGVGIARARGRRIALRTARTATQERDRLAQQLAAERAEHEPRDMVDREDHKEPSPDAIPLPTSQEDSAEQRGQ